jgi:hypothetical protein
MKRQPWIGKPLTDILFIQLPPLLSLLFIFLFPFFFTTSATMSDASWLILIVLVDVSHVYTTLYRTYFDKSAFKKQKHILTIIPVIGFVAGVLVYSIDSLLFWRLLAYVAVFHFVRQQYGFIRVYSRYEIAYPLSRRIDAVAVYTATLYPLLYWHLSGPRNFNWFVKGDFIYYSAPLVLQISGWLYAAVIFVYVLKECWLIFQTKTWNLPRNGIMIGTFLSWYFGIIYFNGDLVFTLLNVISHGIPYMALVWIHGQKKNPQNYSAGQILQRVYSRYGIFLFLFIILFFAVMEESLWDLFVWKEHDTVLLTAMLPKIKIPNELLAFLVPALALPQVTHYILDGFIWKIKKDDFSWSNEVGKVETYHL